MITSQLRHVCKKESLEKNLRDSRNNMLIKYTDALEVVKIYLNI